MLCISSEKMTMKLFFMNGYLRHILYRRFSFLLFQDGKIVAKTQQPDGDSTLEILPYYSLPTLRLLPYLTPSWVPCAELGDTCIAVRTG